MTIYVVKYQSYTRPSGRQYGVNPPIEVNHTLRKFTSQEKAQDFADLLNEAKMFLLPTNTLKYIVETEEIED